VVDAILEGVADVQTLFEHGTMEERRRVIRAFAEGITLDAASGSAELTVKKLPEPDLLGTGSSFQVVAGARCEAQRRKSRTEVVRVRLEGRGRAMAAAAIAWERSVIRESVELGTTPQLKRASR
jgi:hypothetical protein